MNDKTSAGFWNRSNRIKILTFTGVSLQKKKKRLKKEEEYQAIPSLTTHFH